MRSREQEDFGEGAHQPPKKSAEAARIGYALKMFPRLSETFILNEVLELERQGLSLIIFSLKRPADGVTHAQYEQVQSPVSYLPESFRGAPLRIAQAQLYVWRHHRRTWRHTLRNSLRRARMDGDGAAARSFLQACCMARELRGIRHVHAHFASIPAKLALLVQRLTGISFSITTHAKDLFHNDPFGSPKLAERLCRARFVVANSRFSREYILARLKEAASIHTIYNGLDLDTFVPRADEPSEPMILGVGRLVEKKGFDHLLSACALLKERGVRFTCELAGTGRQGEALKEQVRAGRLGGCVRFLGPLPQDKLMHHYERAMVFALPCVAGADGDRDILPNVVKEAMAVGVPVITTRLDGIDELIEDGRSGLLVEPGDATSLANKLELVLRNPGLRRTLAVQGRKVIEERFDRRVNFAQLKVLLLEAVGVRAAQTEAMTTPEPSFYNASCLR